MKANWQKTIGVRKLLLILYMRIWEKTKPSEFVYVFGGFLSTLGNTYCVVQYNRLLNICFF